MAPYYGDFFKIVYKRIWLILTAALLCAVLAFLICVTVVRPVYTASAQIIASTNGVLAEKTTGDTVGTDVTTAQINASLALLKTYNESLKTSKIYNRVLADVQGATAKTYTIEDLRKMVSYSYTTSSLIITVSVDCEKKDDAILLANSIAKIAPTYLCETFTNASATVNEYAYEAPISSPHTMIVTVMTGALAIVVFSALVYLFAKLDNTVKSEEDFSYCDVPFIGTVPDFYPGSKEKRSTMKKKAGKGKKA